MQIGESQHINAKKEEEKTEDLSKVLDTIEEEELLLTEASDSKDTTEQVLIKEPSGGNRLVRAKSIMEQARELSRKLSKPEN